jgi:hypothetical protein
MVRKLCNLLPQLVKCCDHVYVEQTSQDPLKLTFNGKGKGKGNYISVIKVIKKTKATKGKPVKAMKAMKA